MRFWLIFVVVGLLLFNALQSWGLNIWIAAFIIGGLAGLIELLLVALFNWKQFRADKVETDKLPFLVTIHTMNIDGTGDIQIFGRSATEEFAKTILETAVNEHLERFAANDPKMTQETDGTIMLHTDGWSKVFGVQRKEIYEAL